MNEILDIRYEERAVPWSGLGTDISKARNIEEALSLARLDWRIVQKPMNLTDSGEVIPGYYANVRVSDNTVLGIVGQKYSVVQNEEAFSFIDGLIGEGVSFEMAGTFKGGRGVWILAKLPDRYMLSGDNIDPYIVFVNTHDGSGGVRVSMTPIRVFCSNMLNLSMKKASRTWSIRHSGDIRGKLADAQNTMFKALDYMKALNAEAESLRTIKLNQEEVRQIITVLIPVKEEMGGRMKENQYARREDILTRYCEAPDLFCTDETGLRLLHAVSDHATHYRPMRRTKGYQENLFRGTLNGVNLVDRAKEIILAS